MPPGSRVSSYRQGLFILKRGSKLATPRKSEIALMISAKPDSLPHVLICDDDSLFHMTLKQALKGHFQVKSAFNGDEAIAIVRNHPVDIILLDIQMREPTE